MGRSISTIGGSRRSSAPGSLPSAVSGALRALCKAAAPRLARGLEAFVCRSTPGNQGAQWQLQVRPRGEIQETRYSAIGDSVSPSGGWGREGTALPNWVLVDPRGFGSLRGSSTRARGNGSWLQESGALGPGPRRTHPWDARTTGCPSLAPSASVSTSAHWGRRLLSPSPSTSATGQGSLGTGGGSLAGRQAVFGQEAWPCCWVTREVGRCCSEICVRLGHQATIPRPGASELRAVPGCLTQVFSSLYLFILSGGVRGSEKWAVSTVGGTGRKCQNGVSPLLTH